MKVRQIRPEKSSNIFLSSWESEEGLKKKLSTKIRNKQYQKGLNQSLENKIVNWDQKWMNRKIHLHRTLMLAIMTKRDRLQKRSLKHYQSRLTLEKNVAGLLKNLNLKTQLKLLQRRKN
jgi:hypothetical protein